MAVIIISLLVRLSLWSISFIDRVYFRLANLSLNFCWKSFLFPIINDIIPKTGIFFPKSGMNFTLIYKNNQN